MPSFNEIYFQVTGQQAAKSLRTSYPTAYTESGLEFWAADCSIDFSPTDSELARISASVGSDVIRLRFYSVVDTFEFHHWRSGNQVRTLVYGSYAWQRAEGASEPWERETFFSAEDLEDRLYNADATKAAELRRIWQLAEIAVGNEVPTVDPRLPARAIAAYYRLPGWSLETEPTSNE